MIKLRKEYPVEEIGETQLNAIREDNRVMTHLKELVKNWDWEKHDAEDLAEICWRSGFGYAESRFFHLASKEEETEFFKNGDKLPKVE
jgi:hypothetical protein